MGKLSVTPTAVRNAVFDAVHSYVRRQLDVGFDVARYGDQTNGEPDRAGADYESLRLLPSRRTIRRLPRRNDQ
jgi:hypothetical protein